MRSGKDRLKFNKRAPNYRSIKSHFIREAFDESLTNTVFEEYFELDFIQLGEMVLLLFQSDESSRCGNDQVLQQPVARLRRQNTAELQRYDITIM